MISVPFHANPMCIVLPSVLSSHPPLMKCPQCKANVTTKPSRAGLAPNPQPYPGTRSAPLLPSAAQMFNTGCSSMLGTGIPIMYIHSGLLGHLLVSQATDVAAPVLSRNILQFYHQITLLQGSTTPTANQHYTDCNRGTGSKTPNIHILTSSRWSVNSYCSCELHLEQNNALPVSAWEEDIEHIRPKGQEGRSC